MTFHDQMIIGRRKQDVWKTFRLNEPGHLDDLFTAPLGDVVGLHRVHALALV